MSNLTDASSLVDNVTPASVTPIMYALRHMNPDFSELNGMRIAIGYDSAEIEQKRKKILGVTDVSCLRRFSVKGQHAAAWLQKNGIPIPTASNSWLTFGRESSTDENLILRLGSSEFLIEDQFNGVVCGALQQAVVQQASHQPVAAGVYKVARYDAAFILSGSQVLNLLSELCLLDLRDKAWSADALLMTQVAGISATVIRQKINGEQVYRLWCDGTYGAYMWETLTVIADELGGGAVGLALYL